MFSRIKMNYRKKTATTLRMGVAWVERRRMQPTLCILGTAFLLSLSYCPAASLTMSTTPSVMLSSSTPSPSSRTTSSTPTVVPEPLDVSVVPPPASRIDLDQDDLRDTPALSTNSSDHDDVPTTGSTESVGIPVDLLEHLGRESDKLAMDIDATSNFPGGSALASVDDSMPQGGFGMHLTQKMIPSSSPTSFREFEAQAQVKPTAGMYSGGSVFSILSEDDLFLTPSKLLVESFEEAEEKWLSARKMLDERFTLMQGADSKGPIGSAFAFNAPNEESMALSNTSSMLELVSRNFLKKLENVESKVFQRKRRSSFNFNSSPVVFQDNDEFVIRPEDSFDLGSAQSKDSL